VFLFPITVVFLCSAYGKVFLVRKVRGPDRGTLYAMKVLKKANIVQKKKTTEHTRTERQVSNGQKEAFSKWGRTGTGDFKCREVKTGFFRKRSMQTDSSGLSLVGNLVKPLMSLYGNEWRDSVEQSVFSCVHTLQTLIFCGK
jgi:hypothetical protein